MTTDTDTPTFPNRPDVRLVGEDGNVFAIIGQCHRAARRAGWSADDIRRWDAHVQTVGSYDNVLGYVIQTFEVT